MKKALLAVLFLMVTFVIPARADNVSLVSGGPAVGGVDVAPYVLDINGTDVNAICDTFANEITVGETWQANIDPFQANGSVVGLFSTNVLSITKYDEAAQLYSAYLGGSADAAGTNYAIWSLFDASVSTTAGFESTDAAGLLSGYVSQAGFNYTNYDLVTPIPGTQSGNLGTAQEFIVDAVSSPTPESGSLLLFGSGMLGLAGLLRRKLLS